MKAGALRGTPRSGSAWAGLLRPDPNSGPASSPPSEPRSRRPIIERIGLAFNRHWTVHYEMAGIAEHDGAAFVGRLLSLARKKVRRDGGELAALWVRENGDGKGGHVHILLHLPLGMTLRNCTRRWIKAAGGTPARRASKVRTIVGSIGNGQPGGERYRANADAVLAYLLKGADGQTARSLGLRRLGEGGPIIGKRAGWTQNIGRIAQKRHKEHFSMLIGLRGS